MIIFEISGTSERKLKGLQTFRGFGVLNQVYWKVIYGDLSVSAVRCVMMSHDDWKMKH